jgi:hypothetical protein
LEVLNLCTDPTEHWYVIGDLAMVLAFGWAGEDDVREGLLTVLARCTDLVKHEPAISSLARALASGWAGDTDVRDQLLAVLNRCTDKEKHDKVISDLIRALASGWPGDPEVAVEIISRAEEFQLTGYRGWERFAVIIGNREQVEQWANACDWKVKAKGFVLRNIISGPTRDQGGAATKKSSSPRAVLIAPREQLRPGLDRRLLEGFSEPDVDFKRIPEHPTDAEIVNPRALIPDGIKTSKSGVGTDNQSRPLASNLFGSAAGVGAVGQELVPQKRTPKETRDLLRIAIRKILERDSEGQSANDIRTDRSITAIIQYEDPSTLNKIRSKHWPEFKVDKIGAGAVWVLDRDKSPKKR